MRIHSASHAIQQAYSIDMTNKRGLAIDMNFSTVTRDMGWRHCDEVESGIIQAALSRLPDHLQAWAIWCHGPRVPEFLPEQGRFFAWLNDDVAIRLLSTDKNYHAATCDKIRDLVAYTAMDYRHYTATGEHLYPVRVIRKRCGILRQNWKPNFVEFHEHYWQLFDQVLDRTVLSVVAQALDRINPE